MKLTRRNFLAWASLSAVGAVACEGFGIRHGEFDIQSPVRLPEDLVKGRDNWYATICRNCASGEGIVVRVMEGRAKKVEGNPAYPVNRGKHSASCEAGLQALYHPDRIPHPLQRNGPRGLGQFTQIPWPNALDILKQRLEERGDSMLMVTQPLRGHLGMLVNRFTDAVGGSHLGFESLDTNTYRSAIRNVYGQELLPDFDLENTRFLLSFSADFLSTWVSPVRWGLGYGEFRQGAGRERGELYQVDPRFSMTAANADKWLPIKPGWEGHLALSLAYVIIAENLQARGVDAASLTGGKGAAVLEPFRPEVLADRIFLADNLRGSEGAEEIRRVAREFAAKKPALAIGGGSAGAHSNGLFNLEAIYALNYLVGSVGTEGGVQFNPHSPLEGVPAGSQAASLSDWEDVAQDLSGGKTRLLLLHQADPVHGLPASLRFREALTEPNDLFVVGFSPFIDDTSALADLILPDRVYLEDWGDDIPEPGPGHQALGFQQPVVNPLYEIEPQSFPDILLAMAQELGKEAELPWPKYQDLLREGSDALFALNRGSIQASSADEFWTKLLQRGGWWDEGATGPRRVTAPDGLYSRLASKAKEPQGSGAGTFYLTPFAHNSLSDGRNAHLPWLQGAPDPLSTITWQTWLEISDQDARELNIREGGRGLGRILSRLHSSASLPHAGRPPRHRVRARGPGSASWLALCH